DFCVLTPHLINYLFNSMSIRSFSFTLFFFTVTSLTLIFTLSLHDALPISVLVIRLRSLRLLRVSGIVMRLRMFLLNGGSAGMPRSEERFSRNAETDLVCRLLLEKKKNKIRFIIIAVS